MDLYTAVLELWGDHGAYVHPLPKLNVYVTEFAKDGPFQGILGRDVLNRCHLSYQGRERRFTLEF